MNTSRSTRHTGRFEVVADDGRIFTIDEYTELLKITDLSGHTEWQNGQRALRNGPHPVNTNDDGTFDVFTGGEHPVRCRRA